MSSASLAFECIQAVSPLLKMIVDDDEIHNGQLKYPDTITNVKEAISFLTNLSRDATNACVDLKSGLDQLEGKSKKVDRNSEEGILVHMLLQSIRLLPVEIDRLKKLDETDKIDRYFPQDRNNKYFLALQNLVKKHNGDADAESVVSLSDSAFPSKENDTKTKKTSLQNNVEVSTTELPAATSESDSQVAKSESEPAATSESASQVAKSESQAATSESEPTAKSESEPAATSESEPTEKSESVVRSESEQTSASESESAAKSESDLENSIEGKEPETNKSKNKTKKDVDDVSISLIEEASEILEEPLVIIKTETITINGLSREQLMAEKTKYKTHKQKDAFIEKLIDALVAAESLPAPQTQIKNTEKKSNALEANLSNAYVVEDVSKFSRKKDGVEQVLVKWKDFPIEEMTWENKTDTLTRSNVGGSFFQATDTSYKKFCERVGLDQNCVKIQEKDKKNCEKRNSEKKNGEKLEDCSPGDSEPEIDDENKEESEENSDSEEKESTDEQIEDLANESEDLTDDESNNMKVTVESADDDDSIEGDELAEIFVE